MLLRSGFTVLTILGTAVVVLLPTVDVHHMRTLCHHHLARNDGLLAIVTDTFLYIGFRHILLIVFHGERLRLDERNHNLHDDEEEGDSQESH